MNALDLVLVLLAVGYALSGYRQGFVLGAASTAGLLLGGYVGAVIAPALLGNFAPSVTLSFVALTIVVSVALLGRTLGAFAGSPLRNGLTWRPARVFDALSGSALSAVAVLLIAWVLGVAVSGVQVRPLSREVRTSVVLRAIDHALPGGADRVLATFNSLVDSSVFPRYLEPFASEHITSVPPPKRGILRVPAVRSARASVVKVVGAAASCGHTLEGSGFVYDTGRVMTNAHVVAGVDNPLVEVAGGQYRAVVVYYDPNVDIAVLSVPGLPAAPLHFGPPVRSRTPAAVLGFPENGPYDVEPARVRDLQTLRSPNIYGTSQVERQTYSVYAVVRPGNSGGPLIDRRGRVLGVVFAASVTDGSTGYAVTADQVAAAARQGDSSATRVGTGACAQ